MPQWGTTADEVYGKIHAINAGVDMGLPDQSIVVILSGGMDSATIFALAHKLNPEKLIGLTFDYGQQHNSEILKARELGEHYDTDVRTINISSLASYFRTALKKDSDLAIPDHAKSGVIPPTYVPFRNTVFLSIALGYAESWGYGKVFYGANAVDYSGYPDCRPEYVNAINDVVAQHHVRISVEAPIIALSKKEIVKLGNKLEVPWEKTTSCYRGGEKACGKCPSCEYRLKGFEENGIPDPIAYET